MFVSVEGMGGKLGWRNGINLLSARCISTNLLFAK